MTDNETSLGWLTYADIGDRSWYSSDSDGLGLEEWLQRVELLGLPTYQTFSDLPSPASPASANPSGDAGPQRQFAAVIDEKTVYRTDGSNWNEWLSQGEWKEDGNSPFTATSTDSITCNLADEYDEWKITIEWSNHDDAYNTNWSMEINGDTGTNYTDVDVSGTISSDNNSALIAQDVVAQGGSNATRATFVVDGNWSTNGTCSLTADNAQGTIQTNSNREPVIYAEADVAPPLSSFRVFNGFTDTSDLRVVAKGRDV